MIVDQTEYETAAACMVSAGQQGCEYRDELLGRVGGGFARREPRMQAGKYVRALTADVPRKNGWQIAEWAGDASPDKMQRLLNQAVWDEQAAMGIVAQFVAEHLGGAEVDRYATVVLDESGQEKKGGRTAGVKRQYVGCAGRVSNAVNVVYATWATVRGHALAGARPYLPKEWACDPRLRAVAAIPQQVQFRTKPQLAIDILTDLHAAGLAPPWATGDQVYGRDPALRGWCEAHGVGYVFGVPCSFMITLPCGQRMRADQALTLVLPEAWNRASCGAGSKGDRTYDWAWLAVASDRHHLLIRRSLTDPAEVAFFYCYVPAGRPATLPALLTVAGRRWPVEEDFQVGKDQFGLDHSQVRHYKPLLRHLVLTMIALAACAVTAAAMRQATNTLPPPPTNPHDQPPDDPGLIPLTVAEIRRLTNLVIHSGQQLAHHLRWIWWRRRHQARARWFHHRARLRREPLIPLTT